MSQRAVKRREVLGVGALTLLLLLPFLGKAVSLDAPLFLAVANRIVESPIDPMGFDMFWDSTSLHMYVFNRNPPLLSYYLASWIALFGEREMVLHAAVLPFPLVAALSFLGISRRFQAGGILPTLLLVTTPAFVLLGTTLLLDVPVLACMLYAVYVLLRARDSGGGGWLWLAGVAAALAGLVKYVGFVTAPLLVAGAFLLLPRPGRALPRILLPPLVAWGLWGVMSAVLYGKPHFLTSGEVVAIRNTDPGVIWTHLASVPVYHGGALLFPIGLWATRLLRGRAFTELAVLALVLGAAVAAFVLPDGRPERRHPLEFEEAVLAALGFAGAVFLWAALLVPRRILASAEERFLGIWLGGILVFAFFLNWHVKSSDALLAAPPLLLLLFRNPRLVPSRRWVVRCVAVVLPLSLLVAAAEAIQANAYRKVAGEIAAEIGDRPGQRWLVGHWGFQHYLVREGFQPVLPLAFAAPALEVGDWLAAPRNVAQLDVTQHQRLYQLEPVRTWEWRSWLPLRANNHDAGAGFYSHRVGYVPFAWSREPFERVQLARVESLKGGAGPGPGAPSAPR
jgi:4-amino-4-deoxy-L-arabinose transferase-like glycosyltransferase